MNDFGDASPMKRQGTELPSSDTNSNSSKNPTARRRLGFASNVDVIFASPRNDETRPLLLEHNRVDNPEEIPNTSIVHNNGEDAADISRLRTSLQRRFKENSDDFKQSRRDRSAFFLRIARWLLSHFFFCRFFFTFTIVFVSSVVIFVSDSNDANIGFIDAIFVSVSAMSGTGLASIDTGKFGLISRSMFHITVTLGSVSFFGNCVSLLRAYVAENEQEWMQLKVAGWGGHVLYAGAIFVGSCLMAIENGWEYGFRAGDGAFGNCMFNAPPHIKEKKFTLFMAWLLTSTGICLYPLILRAWLRLLGIVGRFECVKNRVAQKWRDALQDCLEAPSSQCHLFLFDPSTTKFVVCYFTFVTMIQLIPLLCHQGMPFFQALAQTSGTRFSGLALLDFHDLNAGILMIFYFVLYVPGVWVPRVTQRVSGGHDHPAKENNNNNPSLASSNLKTIPLSTSATAQQQTGSRLAASNHYGLSSDDQADFSVNNALSINQPSPNINNNNNNNDDESRTDNSKDQPQVALASPIRPSAQAHVFVGAEHAEPMTHVASQHSSTDGMRHRAPLNDTGINNQSFSQRVRAGSTRASTRVSVRKSVQLVDDQWYGMSYAGTDALQVLGDGSSSSSSSSSDDDKQRPKSGGRGAHAASRSDSNSESEISFLRHQRHHKVTTFSLLRKAFKTLLLEDKFWLFVAILLVSGVEYSRDEQFPAQLYEFGMEIMGAYSGSGITMYGWGNNHATYGGYSLSAVLCRFSQCVLILTMYSGAMRGFVFFKVPVPDESEVEIFKK